MNVSYRCTNCDRVSRHPLFESTAELECPACHHVVRACQGAVANGRVTRCALCSGRELFVRKDFNQRLGVAIIVVGFAVATITWGIHRPLWTYAILFATAGVDLAVYFLVGNLLNCYRCHAEYRDVSGLEAHRPFDLETYERFRQQAARMAEAHKE